MDKKATTDYPIMAQLESRWSPRAFDPNYDISQQELGSLLEAARWAPSSSNSQPWSFVVGVRGDDTFHTIFESLASGNQVWAGSASVLIVNVVETENAEGKALSHSAYDVGQAAAHLSVQATDLGLIVHQMGGFNREALAKALGLESRFSPFVVMAVGRIGDANDLPDAVREREVQPRVRKPLAEVAPGLF